jgi:uncharacterized phage protein (TIGR01671 family)
MAREIKFRAWVRGYMVNVVSIDFINEFIAWDNNQWSRSDPPNKLFETEIFEEVVLMQYIGLKDKNGKEIFEGDIVSSNKTLSGGLIKWAVVYHIDRFCLRDTKNRLSPFIVNK